MSNRTHAHLTPSFDREAFAPLLRHLESGQGVTDRVVFPRGTMLPHGRLDLCKQGVGIEGAVLLARSLRFHRFVSSLLLGADELRNEGAHAISSLVESNESLTTVFLGCNLIDREGASSLAGAMSGHLTLRGLWVKRNPLGDEGVRLIANAARHARSLRTLDLAQVELSDVESALSPLRGHPSLRSVYLSGNALGPSSWLGEWMAGSPLRAIFLSANQLGDEGVARLASETLETLSLASNGLSSASLRSLAEAKFPALQTLDLGTSPSASVLGAPENAFDDVSALAAMIRSSPALERLSLPALSAEGVSALLDAVESRGRSLRIDVRNVIDPLVRARLRAAASGVPRRVDEDVQAIESVYRVEAEKRVVTPVRAKTAPPPSVQMPTREELERCRETLRALSAHAELAASKDPAALGVRAEANRLIAAIQGQVRTSTRARAKNERAEARAHMRAHDRAVLEATEIRGATSTVESRTLIKPRDCYVCKAAYVEVDAHYDSLCPDCARENVAKRAQTADLRGRRAVLTGGRVKIGFQIALSLLRSGASVDVTTRFPCDAALRYSREPDFTAFSHRLRIHGLDLRDLGAVERFVGSITRHRNDVDILVNNAAQTVRRPPAFFRHLLEVEEAGPEALPEGVRHLVAEVIHPHVELSQLPILPGDTSEVDFPTGELDANGQQIDNRALNSWALLVDEVDRRELVEVHHVNAFAPFVLVSRLLPHMLASPHRARFVVNVSAMEGKFDYRQKRPNHPHTNMAKAALNMLTRTSGPTLAQWGVYMTSVDTGWITNEQPREVADRMRELYGFTLPLTEADGAARVLDPIYCALNGAEPRHSVFLKDYRVTSW